MILFSLYRKACVERRRDNRHRWINKTCWTNWTYPESTLDLDTPMITLTLVNKTIIEGRALNLTCNTTGSDSITYNWFLPNRTTVTSNILQIANINRSDAGIYNCTTSSTAGNKTLTAFTTTTITVSCKCTINMFFICI